jgi:hypothetical protein
MRTVRQMNCYLVCRQICSRVPEAGIRLLFLILGERLHRWPISRTGTA